MSEPTADLARDAEGRVLHHPVMVDRIVELLSPALSGPESWYLDMTLGMAGHAAAILTAAPQARLIGIDRDADALRVARERLAPFGDRVTLVRARFDEWDEALGQAGVRQVDAVLADLGLSSLQIDRPERGFSYTRPAPLDMRMDDRAELDAATVLASYPFERLATILRRYGEERFADRIARALVARREQQGPLRTTTELVDLITRAIPAAARYAGGGHPAKRTFQALRIEVNGELEALSAALPRALAALAVDGRMAVLSYHSLEDRLVKQAFAAASSDQAPPDLPVVPEGLKARMELLTRGAERPSPAEEAANPRSASARLRAVRRIRPEQSGVTR